MPPPMWSRRAVWPLARSWPSPRRRLPNPEAEAELLALAETASLKEVQERSRQIRREASPETDEQRALNAQRRRNLWHWIDDDNGDGVASGGSHRPSTPK